MRTKPPTIGDWVLHNATFGAGGCAGVALTHGLWPSALLVLALAHLARFGTPVLLDWMEHRRQGRP